MSTLKLMSFALLSGCALVGAARAADVPYDPYAVNPSTNVGYGVSRALSWQGAYAGVHVGGGWGKAGPLNTSGFVAGAQGGYNVQYDRFVGGAEVDFGASTIGDRQSDQKTLNGWLGSMRLRGGYTFGNLMPYLTLGGAAGKVDFKTPWGVSSDTNIGWAFGFGTEMMIAPSVSIRAEYLRYELGSYDYPSSTGLSKVDATSNVIRGGFNYKF